MEEKLHYRKCVNSSRDVVEHDPGSFWKSFQLPNGRGLKDVKDSKKYKTGKESLPFKRHGD